MSTPAGKIEPFDLDMHPSIAGLVGELPWKEKDGEPDHLRGGRRPAWTESRRDEWLRALCMTLDLVFETVSAEDDVTPLKLADVVRFPRQAQRIGLGVLSSTTDQPAEIAPPQVEYVDHTAEVEKLTSERDALQELLDLVVAERDALKIEMAEADSNHQDELEVERSKRVATETELARAREMKKRVTAGRPPATHCAKGHEFTPDNTYLKPIQDGGTQRVCRKCKRDYAAAARAKKSGKPFTPTPPDAETSESESSGIWTKRHAATTPQPTPSYPPASPGLTKPGQTTQLASPDPARIRCKVDDCDETVPHTRSDQVCDIHQAALVVGGTVEIEGVEYHRAYGSLRPTENSKPRCVVCNAKLSKWNTNRSETPRCAAHEKERPA